MKITQAILDDLTAKAKASPRFRMNLDLRNGAECVFRARCGRIPEQGKLKVSPSNSDLEIGYWTERTIRKDNEIICILSLVIYLHHA